MTVLLECFTLTLIVLLQNIIMPVSKPDWFLEDCETPLEMPLLLLTSIQC